MPTLLYRFLATPVYCNKKLKSILKWLMNRDTIFKLAMHSYSGCGKYSKTDIEPKVLRPCHLLQYSTAGTW